MCQVPTTRNKSKSSLAPVPGGDIDSGIFCCLVKTAEPLVLVVGDLVRKKNRCWNALLLFALNPFSLWI